MMVTSAVSMGIQGASSTGGGDGKRLDNVPGVGDDDLMP